ncbi:murein biosynthesis integral membrane protein MurJ [Kineococcus rhizosphaerae]|uniref:murein biosynthesis integral membrane protein MurJ n=1 Tax=Kineococcus rhizosphaerae TaxID=559628 RepID=UPI001B802E88|nr:murein biosynthesis integral membrane protein MurJ [Kineococcus rhizosphaerae]
MSAEVDEPTTASKDSLARSSALMASGTLVSRVLGFVRVALLASAIGGTAAGVGGQVFDVANKAPNNFYILVAGGVLNAVLVPQIVKAFRLPDGGQEFVDRLITLALLIMAVATVLITAAAPLVVRLYSKGWNDDWLALGTAMAFWCLPQVFFYGLYTVLGQVLNARGSFGPFMWAPVVNNVVAIGGTVAFLAVYPGGEGFTAQRWTPQMIALLAGTATAGVALQALVLLWPLHRVGFRYRPRFGFRGMGLGSAGRVAGWTFAGVLVGQVAFIPTSKVMTAAGEALNAAHVDGASGNSYSYAYLLFMLPHSLVAVSLVTALFTRLSKAAVAGDVAAVRRDFSSGARTVAVAGALAVAAFVSLGPAVGGAMFGARPIGQVLVAMAVGLVPFSVTYLVQRVFYAYEDARTPFVVQVVVAAVTTVGNVVIHFEVPVQWQVVAIGVSMSAANVVGCVLGLSLLRRRFHALDGRGVDGHRLLRTLVRLTIITVLAAVVGFAVARAGALVGQGRVVDLAVVLVGGVLVLAVFTLLCRLMRVRELEDLVNPLLRRVPGLRRL